MGRSYEVLLRIHYRNVYLDDHNRQINKDQILITPTMHTIIEYIELSDTKALEVELSSIVEYSDRDSDGEFGAMGYGGIGIDSVTWNTDQYQPFENQAIEIHVQAHYLRLKDEIIDSWISDQMDSAA